MKLFFIPALLLGLMSCQKVDDMHAKTIEMAATTSEMKTLTEDLRELSAWMFNVMKQGDSSRLRDEAIKDMVSSESLARKTLLATKYFYGFEYQVWNSPRFKANVDNIELREKLKAGAVIEFAKTLTEFIPSTLPETGLAQDQDMLNLYALSLSMHKVNDYQQDLLRGSQAHPSLSITSMLSIIADGLSVAARFERGEISRTELTPSQIEVLREEDTFIYALKLRYKFLPIFALSRISNLAQNQIQMANETWKPDFLIEGKMNLEEINYAIEILVGAKQTKEILAKRGIAISLDPVVTRILSHMSRDLLVQPTDGQNTRMTQVNKSLNVFYRTLDYLLQNP